MKGARKVSLAFELDGLASALNGLRILAEALGQNGLATEDDARAVPMAVAASLAALGSRITQLRRVVRGEADPRSVWTSFNDATGIASDGADVMFEVWEHGAPAKRRRR